MLSLFICQVPTFLLGGWSIAIYSGNYIRKLNMNYESNYILELVHLVSISYQDTAKVSSTSWWPLPRLVSLPMTSFITRFLCVSHIVVYQCPFLTRTQLNLAQPAGDHCQDRSFYPWCHLSQVFCVCLTLLCAARCPVPWQSITLSTKAP